MYLNDTLKEIVGEPGLRPLVVKDPFSLDSLIAWLEKQPGETTYCYMHHGQCLLGQYFSAAGFTGLWIGGFTWSADGVENRDLPEGFEAIAHGGPCDLIHTFGAALSRARALRDAP